MLFCLYYYYYFAFVFLCTFSSQYYFFSTLCLVGIFSLFLLRTLSLSIYLSIFLSHVSIHIGVCLSTNVLFIVSFHSSLSILFILTISPQPLSSTSSLSPSRSPLPFCLSLPSSLHPLSLGSIFLLLFSLASFSSSWFPLLHSCASHYPAINITRVATSTPWHDSFPCLIRILSSTSRPKMKPWKPWLYTDCNSNSFIHTQFTVQQGLGGFWVCMGLYSRLGSDHDDAGNVKRIDTTWARRGKIGLGRETIRVRLGCVWLWWGMKGQEWGQEKKRVKLSEIGLEMDGLGRDGLFCCYVMPCSCFVIHGNAM